MDLTTSITPYDVAIVLGQPSPSAGGVQYNQWQAWIDETLMLIQQRATDLTSDVSQVKLDYVIREVVADTVRRINQASNPDYGYFRPRTVDDFWVMLGLRTARGRAFEVDTIGSGGVFHDTDAMWRTIGVIR